ncbi:DUF2971 domain-containing protein [Methylobacterium aquaticum]|jgi:Protein of unknown function (DUF2971)|uniref:DUF2971 domain-containing protein n=1 Tax=Methylobacterium aquaticum TaxID=270351 RepID=UPI0009E5FA02|nr:DUF2971 domain-containing protein [Methylobacterium aquaticum]
MTEDEIAKNFFETIKKLDNRPNPPAKLYKYLSTERIDVLQNGMIRLTPLIGTNDIFEVRRNFKKFVGPGMSAAFKSNPIILERVHDLIVLNFAQKLRIDPLANRKMILDKVRSGLGPNYEEFISGMVKNYFDQLFTPYANSDEHITDFLENMGKRMLVLSLTEDSHNSVMWPHYAEQGRGFVIEFDTSKKILPFEYLPNAKPLYKVAYSDVMVEEFFENPYGMIASKTKKWSYEDEWRIFGNQNDAQKIIKAADEDIHLFKYDATSVTKVILGYASKTEFREMVAKAVGSMLPNAKITVLTPKRFDREFVETDL